MYLLPENQHAEKTTDGQKVEKDQIEQGKVKKRKTPREAVHVAACSFFRFGRGLERINNGFTTRKTKIESSKRIVVGDFLGIPGF